MTGTGSSRRRSRWRMLAGLAVAAVVAALLFDYFPNTQRALRGGLREAIEGALPDASERAADAFGLIPMGSATDRSSGSGQPRGSVVLIPGLDDPGLAWQNLAPALIDMGLDVWQLSYPNDQPIVDSSWFAYRAFTDLVPAGDGTIVIVAHSMGGLVAREMLTNPEIAYVSAARDGQVPVVTDLVMVATPHHGSEMARFRLLTEARELWINSVQGGESLLRAIVDGAGEAKLDLLPGSEFLERLNDRPHPEGVRMVNVAGTIGQWESDGLVPLASTQLEGVEHHTVAGTHMTLIRNLDASSERMPPAVGVIAEYLEPGLRRQR